MGGGQVPLWYYREVLTGSLYLGGRALLWGVVGGRCCGDLMMGGVYIWRIVSCGARGWDIELRADGAAGQCPRSCAVIAGVCQRGRLEGEVTVDGGEGPSQSDA